MKKSLVFVILISLLLFVGCSNTEKIVISEQSVYNAILVDDTAALSLALNLGFSVDYKNKEDISLLNYAINRNSTKSISILSKRVVDIDRDKLIFKVKSFNSLKSLVENGANINIKNEEGESLLSFFVKKESIIYVKYLLDNSVDLDVIDSNGYTPIFWAIHSNNVEILSLLIKYGGNPVTLDTKGNYPLYYTKNKDSLKILLNFNYDLDKKNKNGENIFGEIYFSAIANGQFEIIDILINKGIDLNYKSYGDTALSIAKKSGNQEMINYIIKKTQK
ncbi:MAG: ankyrin repeat domain-containing protein [Fusobacteriaceae bacterium]